MRSILVVIYVVMTYTSSYSIATGNCNQRICHTNYCVLVVSCVLKREKSGYDFVGADSMG